MTLTEKEYKDFLESHLKLLYFIGKQLKIIQDISFDKFLKVSKNTKYKCQQVLNTDKSIIDNYIQINFDDLSENEIGILNGFKQQLTGTFIILKCLSKHAIFLDTNDNSFYAVNALGDRFDEFFDEFPTLVNTSILPFGEKIIYNGFMDIPPMHLGSNIVRTLKADYKKAKAQNKIRTSIADEQTSY